MKKIFAFLVLMAIGIILASGVWAQSPQKMSYQAVIRNSANELVTLTGVGMQISILQSSAMGGTTSVYVETQTPTSNINGLVSLEVGAGTVISGTFSTIDWAKGPFYIKTETDPAGGTNYSITGTSQLLSVPYALFSANGTPAGTHAGEMLYWDGNKWIAVAPGVTGQTLNYCFDVPTWGTCRNPVIGDNYQGGIVFYILQMGDLGFISGETHGLIAASSDQSSGIKWGNNYNPTGATSSALFSGQANTTAIISNQGAGSYAAKLCDDLILNAYSDWYLPSISELALMRTNILQSGNFANDIYWSSTESSTNSGYAWFLNFNINSKYTNLKIVQFHVRAIRSF